MNKIINENILFSFSLRYYNYDNINKHFLNKNKIWYTIWYSDQSWRNLSWLLLVEANALSKLKKIKRLLAIWNGLIIFAKSCGNRWITRNRSLKYCLDFLKIQKAKTKKSMKKRKLYKYKTHSIEKLYTHFKFCLNYTVKK